MPQLTISNEQFQKNSQPPATLPPSQSSNPPTFQPSNLPTFQPPPPLTPAEAAHLWQLVRIYQNLGRIISLPTRLPQTLIDTLTTLAKAEDLAAAEIAAEQTLAALSDALDGWSVFPEWRRDGLPEADSLVVIEAALAAGQLLKLAYYSAGRDELTHRLVEPYRLEWRGDTPYLVAFCRRAQAERVFRLDRIHAIAASA